ncbi:MAG: AAA family ATPase [Candidatus Methanoplasma sp.]|jgi:hypothetical protein|nr:AAA family ATPase [Candidatus Methanoplasma sp.]
MLSVGAAESEWLYDLSGSKGRIAFFRKGEEASCGLDLSEEERKCFEVYSAEARGSRSSTLLSVLSRAPGSVGAPLFGAVRAVSGWLARSLIIMDVRGDSEPGAGHFRDDLARKVLPLYGTGVSDVRFDDLDGGLNPFEGGLNGRRIGKQSVADAVLDGRDLFIRALDEKGDWIAKRMVFDHGGVAFGLAEESDGARRLYDLAPILDRGGERELTYVIDEIGRSLHPQLAKRLIGDFEALGADSNRQLIFTSHESRLLDLNLLRRDEIWFAEKGAAGESRLYSLEEFSERIDRRIDKAYLEGRYGGTPRFRTAFPDPGAQ